MGPVHARRRTVARSLGVALGVALLLLGATTPSSCTPKPLPISSLYGRVSQGTRGTGVTDTSCPTVDSRFGPIRGLREKWGARIAAADPKEWLSIRPCVAPVGRDFSDISGGPFTIYTASGDVTGTVDGTIDDAAQGDAFQISLTIKSGTKAYQSARGTLWFSGCLNGSTITSGSVRATANPDFVTACTPRPPDLRPLLGRVSTGSRAAGVADSTCPVVAGAFGPERGLREKWGLRIAAADPNEWLSMRLCVSTGTKVVQTVDAGPFTIYTATGDVHGTVQGTIEDGRTSTTVVRLTITDGTKAWANATGTLWLAACVDGSGKVVSGALTTAEPTDAFARCNA